MLFSLKSHFSNCLSLCCTLNYRTGVDGIITNHPERVVTLLRDAEFSKDFRLADQDDDPWARVQARQDVGGEANSPAAPSTQPIQLRWAAGFGDMVTSFAKYLRDFVYLRVPSYHSISKRSLRDLVLWPPHRETSSSGDPKQSERKS